MCVLFNALRWSSWLLGPLGWRELHHCTDLHHQTSLPSEQGVPGTGVDLWWRSGLQRWVGWKGAQQIGLRDSIATMLAKQMCIHILLLFGRIVLWNHWNVASSSGLVYPRPSASPQVGGATAWTTVTTGATKLNVSITHFCKCYAWWVGLF